MSNLPEPASSPCPTCGAPLPEAPYVRVVTCPYCKKPHPNVACIAVGAEVLVIGNFPDKFDLLSVARCTGPDGIFVGQNPSPLKIEDVIPVVRPTTLAPNVRVYFNDMIGWSRSWTASPSDGDAVRVKHSDSSFQDGVFDRTVPLSSIRLDARPQGQRSRSYFQALSDRFRSDPFGASVQVIIGLVFAGFALGALALLGSCAVAVMRGK